MQECSGAIYRTDEMLKQVQHDKYEPERLNRPEGIGRIIQALVIDGVGLDTTFVTPNHLKRISVWLPESVYRDGEIIIEIKKIKGKRVVLSEIGLYEFPQEEKGKMASGPQGEEAIRPTIYELRLLPIYPNPFKDKVMIRCWIQNTGYRIQDISLKVYDATGRLVRDFSRLTVNGERSTILWDGTDDYGRRLPSGVYFMRLETEGYTKTEKAVFLK